MEIDTAARNSSAPDPYSGEQVYTPTMTLKSAALFALIGMILLTVLLLAVFVRDLLSFVRDVIPALTLFASLIHAFASLGLTVFLYVFHKRQS